MKKRLLSMFTALALCAAFVPAPALGEEATGEGAAASAAGLIGGLGEGETPDLGNNYNKGEDSGSGLIGAGGSAAPENGVVEVSTKDALLNDVAQGGEVKLTADITIDASLNIAGVAVTLDLNGHVLKYENSEKPGSVIKVWDCGNLTIKDSNPAAEYKFTPNDDGLWVLDKQDGTETIKGGIITGGTGTNIDGAIGTYGGGVFVEPKGALVMTGGNIVGCFASSSGGGVYNEGRFTMKSGAIESCTAADGLSGGVWNSGEFTMSNGVIGNSDSNGNDASDIRNIAYSTANFTIRDKAEIYAKVTNEHVLNADGGEIRGMVTNTISGTISGSNSTSTTFTGEMINDGKIERGMFTGSVINNGTITSGTFAGSVTVGGSMIVDANCQVIFEGDNSSLTISKGGTVKTVAAGDDAKPGLLSLGEGVALTVEGTLVNNGILYVSDTTNLKVAANVGGNLCLDNVTVTENCTLDMKECLLTIEGFLKFENGANLIVKNAKQVNATDVSLSGGSYYCRVIAGDNEGTVTGGNFYDTVTFRSQAGGQAIRVSGGTFYGKMKGKHSTEGHPKVTFKDGEDVYAIQVTSGKAVAPDTPSKSGYTFAGWYTGAGEKFDFENTSVTSDITLTAKWTINSSPRYQVVVPDELPHGTLDVSAKYAYRGATVTITATPDSGYVLETLVATDARGNELALTDKGDDTFTFVMPGGKVEVRATFMEDNSLLNFFFDVPNDAYFYEAVKWAAASGIAQGYGNGMFGPYDVCTRAQVVTFLWRAAGAPEPSTLSDFADIPQDAYYAKAVAWAVEAGIAHGYSSDVFGPDDACTRAQTVTFLWRAAGSSATSGEDAFTDVSEGAYYEDAVAWAAEEGIAQGYGDGTFGPDDGCARGQAVTFLWRADQSDQ